MCGIAGIINFDKKKVEVSQLKKMNAFMSNRGPDAEGYWQDKNIGCSHKRLSIIDISDKGLQPMLNKGKTAVITYNGEIYNFKSLRNLLQKAGYHFYSDTDTEVILNGYLYWGIDKLLEQLDGMFAFVIYDLKKQIAFACRDRFGQKPLYYLSNSDQFIFASDIKAIKSVSKTLNLNYNSLDYYLSELSVPQPLSIWEEINQVQEAHYIKINLQQFKTIEKKYWDLDFSKKNKLSETENIKIVENKLITAIEKRLVGDVEIGTFLSSGIDSGLITALLSSKLNKRVKSFTAGFDYNEYNEIPLARELANKYNTQHTEINIQADIINTIEESIDFFGEPFADSSCIPSFLLSKEIKKKLKVVLSGDGGDETFGGYHDYKWASQADNYLQKYPSKLLRSPIKITNQVLNKIITTNDNYGHIEAYIKMPDYLKLYRNMGFSPVEKSLLYNNNAKYVNGNFTSEFLKKLWRKNAKGNYTDSIFSTSIHSRLLNDYLVKVDRTSMANGLEVRSPFLDKDLVEFAVSIPNGIKLKHNTEKYLLKKLGQKYIDENIFNRKKQGFGIPLNHWLKKDLKTFSHDLLLSQTFKNRKLFNQAYIEKILEEHQTNKQEHTHRIWALLCLELWFNKHIDK